MYVANSSPAMIFSATLSAISMGTKLLQMFSCSSDCHSPLPPSQYWFSKYKKCWAWAAKTKFDQA